MTSDYIIDVSEINFEYEVLSYSQNTLVIVDFWAVWCKPCKTLQPLLEKLATEAKGSFRLARVNVDDNPNLALQYNVRSIPTVKAFSEGNVVAEFVGLQPEIRLRKFISDLTPPSPFNLSQEKARSLILNHKWREAETLYRDLLNQDADNPSSLLGLSISLLGQGDSSEALYILKSFPASSQYAQAELLIPYAQSLADYQEDNLPDEQELDATLRNSIKLSQKGNYPAALDGLLEILRQERNYRKGLAHQIILGLLEIMGEDDPQTRGYRSELASLLF